MPEKTSDNANVKNQGSCECGGVSFSVTGFLRPVINCHCNQCLKTHGHYAAYTNCETTGLTFESEGTLRWYHSSDFASRGFCNRCGASLFWKENDASDISIAAGMFDLPTGLMTGGHIFVDSKSDYYDIEDALPQSPESGH